MEVEAKHPVVLLLVDGLGLSTNWSGNAVAMAKMPNFFDLWSKYEHALLCIPDEVRTNPSIAYSLIAAGENIVSNCQIIDDTINQNKFLDASLLVELFDSLKKNNSCLHLIGNFSKNNAKASINHLKSLLRASKVNGVRSCLHLIIDDSFSSIKELTSALLDLEKFLNEKDLGSIVSLVGEGWLLQNKENVSSTISGICKNTGKKFLSIEQAFSNIKATPEKIGFCSLASSANTLIHDFDALIFFNHTNEDLAAFINEFAVCTKSSSLPGKPKFLSLLSLLDYPKRSQSNIQPIFTPECNQYLTKLIHLGGRKESVVGYQENRAVFNHYYLADQTTADEFFCPGAGKLDDSAITQIFNESIKQIKKGLYDLVTINLPFILPGQERIDLKESVALLTKFDEALPALNEAVAAEGGTLVILGTFGKMESLVDNGSVLRDNTGSCVSQSPVPFLIVSSKFLYHKKTDLFHELICPQKDFYLANTVISKLLELPEESHV